jgi:Predicted hydrolases or acyltransferases (alpha/beta hydrolase superfamily)
LTETFTTPEGLTLLYERRGSGPLLVCHPRRPPAARPPSSATSPASTTRSSSCSQPARSHGSDAADDYALASYVADLDGLREHLGLEQLDLLGFSHGGIVAMAYAAAHGQRIRRLVLAATLAVWSEEAEAAMHRTIETRRDEPWFVEAQKAIEEEQAGEFSSSEELVSNVQQQIPLYFHRWKGNEQIGRELAADFAKAEPLHYFNTVEFPTFDLRPELRTITAPTLVLVGDDDLIAGLVSADAMVRELPDARLVTIPGSGHFLYIEQPEAFRAP